MPQMTNILFSNGQKNRKSEKYKEINENKETNTHPVYSHTTSEFTDEHNCNDNDTYQNFVTFARNAKKERRKLFFADISLWSNLGILVEMAHEFIVITEF